MKVLVIGGMGIIGGAITEAAVRKKCEVCVLSRRKLFGKYKNFEISNVCGNWKDDNFAKEVVAHYFDVIVDTLIFNKRELIRDLEIANGHCRQFIYISTDAVYHHPDENVSENRNIEISGLKWGYGYNKRDAELYLLNNRNNYSFYWTVIRPTITYGDTRIPVGFASRKNEWTLIDRILAGRPVLLFNEENSVHAICHTSTFGDATVDLFLKEEAAGEFYHISDDESYSYESILNAISQNLGIEVKFIHASAGEIKRYRKSKYEEMIYDKNPQFTLDNQKIKSMSPNTNYHVNIIESMKSTLSFLKAHNSGLEEDKEYNMISDITILKYKNMNLDSEETEIASKYVKNLSLSYKIRLRLFGIKLVIKSVIRPIALSLFRFIKR